MENSTIIESKILGPFFGFKKYLLKPLSVVFSLFPEKNGLRRIPHCIYYYLLMGCSWTVEASVEAGRTQQLLMIPGHTSSCTAGVAAAAVACCWWVFWTVPCAAPATRGFHRKEHFCFLSQAFWLCRERERQRERMGISELSTRKQFLGDFYQTGWTPWNTHYKHMTLWSRLLSRLQVWSADLDWRYNVDKLSVCLSVCLVIQLASYLQWSWEWSFKVKHFQGALLVVSMVLSK